MRLPKLIKDTILQSKSKVGNHKAIPHNSKCRYGERGTAAAKPKAQIILCVLSSILATQMPYRTPSRSEALRSATAACGGSWRGDPPERCLSRQAGIVRCCQNCPLENKAAGSLNRFPAAFLLVLNFPMPAEAAANVVDISHRLDVAADGFVADAQRHAEFFGADFIVFFD